MPVICVIFFVCCITEAFYMKSHFLIVKDQIIRQSIIHPIIWSFTLHLKCFLYAVIMQEFSFFRKCFDLI